MTADPVLKRRERLTGDRRSRDPEARPGLFGRFPNGSRWSLALLLVAFFRPDLHRPVFLPPDTIAPRSHHPFIEEVRKGGEYPL